MPSVAFRTSITHGPCQPNQDSSTGTCLYVLKVLHCPKKALIFPALHGISTGCTALQSDNTGMDLWDFLPHELFAAETLQSDGDLDEAMVSICLLPVPVWAIMQYIHALVKSNMSEGGLVHACNMLASAHVAFR